MFIRCFHLNRILRSSFRPRRSSCGVLSRRLPPYLEALEARTLLNAGDLDPTFGAGGKVLTDFMGPISASAKATRRMRFDRNQSVESDLTFWARFLSQGAPVVNLGQGPVEDLLLEGAFLSLDVPEEGLIDADPHQDQMPA